MTNSSNLTDIAALGLLNQQDVVIYINTDLQIIGINQAAQHGIKLHHPKDLMSYHNFLDLFTEEEKIMVASEIQEVFKGRAFTSIKTIHSNQNKFFNLIYNPLINSDFKIHGAIIRIELIHNQVEQESIFGEVISNTTIPLIIAKPIKINTEVEDFEILFGNNAIKELLDIQEFTNNSSTIFRLFPGLKSKIQNHNQGKELNYTTIVRRKDIEKSIDLELSYSGKHLLLKVIKESNSIVLENRLNYKQKLIESILECSPTGILVLKAIYNEHQEIIDFEFKFLNQEAARIIGKPLAELQHKSILKVISSQQKQMVLDHFSHVVKTKENRSFEKICHSGWTNVSAIPTEDGLLVNLIDISIEKKTDEQLIKNQELLLQSQAAARVGSMEWNIKEGNIFWTPQSYDFWEYPIETLITHEIILNKVHAEDRDKFRILIDRAIYDGENFADEIRITQSDQSILYLKIEGSIKYNNDNEPIRLICTVMDITDRINAQRERRYSKQLKEAQNQLEESFNQLKRQSEEFKFLTDFMPQMVWSNLPNGQFDFFNNRWYEYTGISDMTSFEHGIRQAIYPEDIEEFNKQWESSVESSSNIEIECRIYKHDRSFRWFLLRAMPLKNQEGQIIKWFGTCTDINEHKLIREQFESTQDELKQKNQELRRKNTDLDSFVYTASHDLKAPINNIEGLVNGLIEECSEHTQHMFLNLINQSISRFKSTIEDLTQITSLTGKPDQSEIVELPLIVSEILESNEDFINQSGAVVTLNLEVNTLSFSRKNIRSVLFNLISNAIKYSSPERIPTIKVSSRYENEQVILEVSDNGLGLNQEDIPKMFGMFKRLHNHVEGTGVGMYIVKRVIENIGGSIEVFSKINEGTTFKLYIPN
jgi:PAS domain S-box-containing protein